MAAPKILVIEDNPSDLYLLRWALDEQNEDYRLTVLTDGEQALDFVREQRTNPGRKEPCVIVLDLHLPKHSGLEVLRAVKDEPVLAHVHIILMTSSASPRDKSVIRNWGAEYRLKPRELAEVVELAAHLLEVCRTHSAAAA